ncbi:MAG: hypothetical protein JWO56_1620 [Acidobacteria bacterium]|nr:hypothetical protein [Acidobacteriota bacterium]
MRKTLLLLVVCLLAATATSAQISMFTGTWVNTNSATRGIVRFTVTGATPVLSIQVWGACHPNPCDWGKQVAYAYGPDVSSNPVTKALAVTSIYNTAFSQTILTLHPNPATMTVNVYTRFTDRSGRFAYTSTEQFRRAP